MNDTITALGLVFNKIGNLTDIKHTMSVYEHIIKYDSLCLKLVHYAKGNQTYYHVFLEDMVFKQPIYQYSHIIILHDSRNPGGKVHHEMTGREILREMQVHIGGLALDEL